jgi:sulfate-transporting ATPase
MAHQYIYSMVNLRKVVPPQREILKGIYLSFLPGAKIGVLGLNGAGKSTLLKIMAGVEKDFAGEAFAAEGTRIGFLPQDPRLDTSKDVLGNVEEGVAKTRGLLKRFEELNEKLAEELSEVESASRTRSRPPTHGSSTGSSRSRWTRCACRPPTPT